MMTTPNIEELIKELEDEEVCRVPHDAWRVMSKAVYALQAQAERIKELGEDVTHLQNTITAMCSAIPDYDWSGGASVLIAKGFAERDTLRAQLAEIEKSEPVFYEFQWTNPGNQPNQPEKMFAWVPVEPSWNGTVQQKVDELLAYRYEDKPTYRVRALFTRPMPADVTELVEALEKLARLGNGEHYGNSDGNMIARDALSKCKGAK